MTELGIGTIVLLEAWLLICSVGMTFYNPFDEWLWFFFMSIYGITLAVAAYALLDKLEAREKVKRWLKE